MLNFIGHIKDFIFPRVCHACGEPLGEGEEFVCTSCMAQMPRTLFHRQKDNPMEKRFVGYFKFRNATALCFYSRDGVVATLVHDMKYRKFSDLAYFLGACMGRELLPTGFLSEIDAIVAVPMHFYKRMKRGYNQTDLLARGLSDATGIPVINAIRARMPHRTQTSKSIEERMKIRPEMFQITKPDTLKNKRILLLDDVCTTGATLSSLAMAILQEIPDCEISMLTLGVTS